MLRRLAGAAAPRWAVVAGSGLADLAGAFASRSETPYADIPGFVPPSVPGHPGRLVLGAAGDTPVWLCLGRPHFYETGSMAPVADFIRTLAHAGVRSLVLTNAAGAIAPDLRAGDLVVIRDQLFLPGLAGHHPLVGPNDPIGTRFPDLHDAYDETLRLGLLHALRASGVRVREGVYAMVAGPSYETAAEVKMLAALGADAVGMSTAPEVVLARHAGLRVVAVSVITNQAAADAGPFVTHQSVTDVSAGAAPRLGAALRHLIESQPD